MALSEQEQRLLEEMERGLYQNDADFVATVGQRRGKPNYTVVVVGALLGVLGIATIIVGVVIQQTLVGALGFVMMFAGVLLAIAPPRRDEPIARTASPRGKPRKAAGFMENLNDRWDKRQDERGR
ncbi:MAG: hypothetical protein JWM50_2630 [Microbacteriaceae bacterium]|jgi:hypothetical protein|nr:hypothetical protein [Microbacteriaceae bacterium]